MERSRRGAARAAASRPGAPAAARPGCSAASARSPLPAEQLLQARRGARTASPARCRPAPRRPGCCAPAGRASSNSTMPTGLRSNQSSSSRAERSARSRATCSAVAVLHHHQQQRAALRVGARVRRAARYQRSRPPASSRRRSNSGPVVGQRRAGAQALARLQRCWRGLPRAAARAGRRPISRSRAKPVNSTIGRVDVDEPEVGVLQRGRETARPRPAGRPRRTPHAARLPTAGADAARRQQAQHRCSRIEPAPGQRAAARRRAGAPAAARRHAASPRCARLQPGARPARRAAASSRRQRQAHGSRAASRVAALLAKLTCAGGVEQQHGLAEAVEQGRAQAASGSRVSGRIGPLSAHARQRASFELRCAAISARSCARLISLTLIISASAASRKSNSDSLSIARTSST